MLESKNTCDTCFFQGNIQQLHATPFQFNTNINQYSVTLHGIVAFRFISCVLLHMVYVSIARYIVITVARHLDALPTK